MKRLPRLLDSSMQQVIRIDALSMSLDQSDDVLSTAKMQVKADEYNINIGDWVELFNPTQSAGIFYVKTMQINQKTKLCDIYLEHGFGTLADRVIVGKLNAAGINGKDKAPVSNIITELLSFQSLWELDVCQFTDSYSFDFENANVYDSIKDVGNAIGNYRLSFDQSSLPWKVSIFDKPIDEEASCEMRMDRNIETMLVTLDRTDMVTRIYPFGKDGITIETVNDGVSYVEKNVDQWGVVEQIYTNSKITDKQELKETVQAMLQQLCQPIATISIDGYYLSKYTGEPMDNIKIGFVCRIPIHYKNRTIVMNERVISLSWQDVLNFPDVVSVTLANRRETASNMASATSKQAKQTANSVQRSNGEIHAKITGIDGSITQLDVDISGIRTRVTDAEGNISAISQTANSVAAEVADARGTSASLKLKVDDMVSQINLKADIITLDGYVKMNTYQAFEGDVRNFFAGAFTASSIRATSATFTSAETGPLSVGSLTIGGSGVGIHNMSVNGKLIGQVVGAGDINFNVADTEEYQDAVSAAQARGWVDGYNAAAAISGREGNIVYFPATTSTKGVKPLSFAIANYTASSHSFRQASATFAGSGTYSSTSFNGTAFGSCSYSPATDSYTASSFSWTGS